VQDHATVETGQHCCGVLVSSPRVDNHRFAEFGSPLQLRLEDAVLLVARRVVPIEVETDLTDRDDTVVDEIAQIGERLIFGGLMRVNSKRHEHAPVRPGKRARRARRLQPGADRDHSRHTGLARAGEGGGCIVKRIEVRMRIDHTGSSFLKSGVGSRSF